MWIKTPNGSGWFIRKGAYYYELVDKKDITKFTGLKMNARTTGLSFNYHYYTNQGINQK